MLLELLRQLQDPKKSCTHLTYMLVDAQARWQYMPASVTCPLALLARWRYLPADVARPLALLARWRCLPAGVTCLLALLAR